MREIYKVDISDFENWLFIFQKIRQIGPLENLIRISENKSALISIYLGDS